GTSRAPRRCSATSECASSSTRTSCRTSRCCGGVGIGTTCRTDVGEHMSPQDTAKIGVAAALLLGAGAVLVSWMWPERAAAEQDVTCWLCTESACAKEFTKPVMELARIRQSNPDANPACPYCGKATALRAVP